MSIVIKLFFLFICLTNHQHCSYFSQADATSCGKQIECFICDSRQNEACEDVRNFSDASIPTGFCDDYCLKIWTRENDSIKGDDKTAALRYVKRDCHTIFRYDIKKTETCYQHKRHPTDYLCLCSSDRCNLSVNDRLKQMHYAFFLFYVFYFLLY